jgi:hypothetical protein
MVACTKDLRDGKFVPNLKADIVKVYPQKDDIGVIHSIHCWERITNNRKITVGAFFPDFDLKGFESHLNFLTRSRDPHWIYCRLSRNYTQGELAHVAQQIKCAFKGESYSFRFSELIVAEMLMSEVLRTGWSEHYLQCGFLKNEDGTYKMVIFFKTTFNRGRNPVVFFYGTL